MVEVQAEHCATWVLLKKPLGVRAVKALGTVRMKPSFCIHHPCHLDRFAVCPVLSKIRLTPTPFLLTGFVFRNLLAHPHTLTCTVSLHIVSQCWGRGQWIHEFVITQSVGCSIIQFYLCASMSGSNLTCTSPQPPLNKVCVVSLS